MDVRGGGDFRADIKRAQEGFVDPEKVRIEAEQAAKQARADFVRDRKVNKEMMVAEVRQIAATRFSALCANVAGVETRSYDFYGSPGSITTIPPIQVPGGLPVINSSDTHLSLRREASGYRELYFISWLKNLSTPSFNGREHDVLGSLAVGIVEKTRDVRVAGQQWTTPVAYDCALLANVNESWARSENHPQEFADSFGALLRLVEIAHDQDPLPEQPFDIPAVASALRFIRPSWHR